MRKSRCDSAVFLFFFVSPVNCLHIETIATSTVGHCISHHGVDGVACELWTMSNKRWKRINSARIVDFRTFHSVLLLFSYLYFIPTPLVGFRLLAATAVATIRVDEFFVTYLRASLEQNKKNLKFAPFVFQQWQNIPLAISGAQHKKNSTIVFFFFCFFFWCMAVCCLE